jgi:hypothetical protein
MLPDPVPLQLGWIQTGSVLECPPPRPGSNGGFGAMSPVDELRESVEEEIQPVARLHGIGVISAADPADWTTWDEIVQAPRREPDPERLDAFIGTQISEDIRSQIARALR